MNNRTLAALQIGSDPTGTRVGYRTAEGREDFLVSACQIQPAPSGNQCKDQAWPKDKPLIRGGSVIISPMGEVLAGPLYNREGLVFAEVDLDDIVKARYDMDPVGHYSRPDIFKLTVDETERPPVKLVSRQAPA